MVSASVSTPNLNSLLSSYRLAETGLVCGTITVTDTPTGLSAGLYLPPNLNAGSPVDLSQAVGARIFINSEDEFAIVRYEKGGGATTGAGEILVNGAELYLGFTAETNSLQDLEDRVIQTINFAPNIAGEETEVRFCLALNPSANTSVAVTDTTGPTPSGFAIVSQPGDGATSFQVSVTWSDPSGVNLTTLPAINVNVPGLGVISAPPDAQVSPTIYTVPTAALSGANTGVIVATVGTAGPLDTAGNATSSGTSLGSATLIVQDTLSPVAGTPTWANPVQLVTDTMARVNVPYTDAANLVDASSATPLQGDLPGIVGTLTLTPDLTALVDGASVVVPYDLTLPTGSTFADATGPLEISTAVAGGIADTEGNAMAGNTVLGSLPIDVRAQVTFSISADGGFFAPVVTVSDARQTIWEFSDGTPSVTSHGPSVTLANGLQTVTALIPISATDITSSGDRITAFSGVGGLTGLTTLRIQSSLLTAIPTEIGSLTALTQLRMENNAVAVLPTEIGNLTALTDVRLSNNAISEIPASIGSLTALAQLRLDNNSISVIPPQIGSLTALTQLRLSNNSIAVIPPEIGTLTALQDLRLSANSIAVIPPEIGNLTTLNLLWLQNNLIATIPTQIGNLTTLTDLRLFENAITALPTEISSLTNLTSLWLYNQTGMTSAIVDQFLSVILAGQPWAGSASIQIHDASPEPTGVYADPAATGTGGKGDAWALINTHGHALLLTNTP